MQELRFVAVSEDGSYAVLAVPGRSGRYILPIDERLRAVAMGQTSRLAQYEIEVESPLRPKEIQARIRAGETAEEIADAAGIPVERVRWFEGPVLAERAYIADQAQAASVRRAGDSGGPGPRLGDIVPERLTASGAAREDGQWDSRKRGDGNWQVTLTFPSGGRLHVAEWVFDSRRRHVMPDDDNAARLSLPESELPPEPVSLPGEATVTPLAPRLGAAAGMGGGGMGGPAWAAASPAAVPASACAPSARSARSSPTAPSAATARWPTGRRCRRRRRVVGPGGTLRRRLGAERPAMSHGQAAPPATPWPAHHDHTAFRDAAPEPVAHRDPAPEPTAYRAAAPGHAGARAARPGRDGPGHRAAVRLRRPARPGRGPGRARSIAPRRLRRARAGLPRRAPRTRAAAAPGTRRRPPARGAVSAAAAAAPARDPRRSPRQPADAAADLAIAARHVTATAPPRAAEPVRRACGGASRHRDVPRAAAAAP